MSRKLINTDLTEEALKIPTAAVLPGQLDIITELEKIKESENQDANE